MSTHPPAPDRDSRGWLPPVDSELSRLAAAMCDGTATVADRERLEVILQDETSRRAYSVLMHLHGELLWQWRTRSQASDGEPMGFPDLGRPPAKQTTPTTQPSLDGGWKAACSEVATQLHGLWVTTGKGFLRHAAAAAAVAVVVAAAMAGGAFVYASVLPPPKKLTPPQSGGPVVANITGMDGALWREPGASVPLSFGIAPDTHLDLARGLVELQFRTGATMVVQGPASLLVCDGNSVNVYDGRVTVRHGVAPPAETEPSPVGATPRLVVVVNTPHGTIRGADAEYGVAVGADIGTRVQVFGGHVEVAASSLGATAITRSAVAGESLLIGPREGEITTALRESGSFARALPGRGGASPGHDWVEGQSRIIYRDGFDGAGSLEASPIYARGGIGRQPWLGRSIAWELENGSLEARTPGLAMLPFTPEAGCVYRLSVTMNVTAGDGSAASIGFLPPVDDRLSLAIEGYAGFLKQGCAWTGQRGRRHEERGDNFACAGPGTSNRIGNIDDRYGRRTRMVQLDTRGPRWVARFFVDGAEMAWFVYDRPPPIAFVGLATDLAVSATFDDFSLAVYRP